MHPGNDQEDYETFHAELVTHFGLAVHQLIASFSHDKLDSPSRFLNSHEGS